MRGREERIAPLAPCPVRVNVSSVRGVMPAAGWVAGAAFALYAAISLVRHVTFRSGLDLAIFDQAIREYAALRTPNLLLKSEAPFSILGDHFHPILIVLAPVYRLVPHVETLLVAQALLISAAVWVVGRWSVDRLGRRGLLVAAAFALSWGVLAAIAFDFHEIAFAVPLLALMLVAAADGRYRSALVWAVPLILTKEDSALLVVGLGLALAAKREWRWAAVFTALGITSFVVILFVVIPAFNPSGHYQYFDTLGGRSSLWQTVISPLLNVLKNLGRGRGIAFTVGLLATLVPFGVRSPFALVIAPTVLARLATLRPEFTGFALHYNATLVAGCAVAIVDGWSRLIGAGRVAGWMRQAQMAMLAAIAVAGLVVGSILPTAISAFRSCPDCVDASAVVDLVPNGVKVAADTVLAPHLTDRTDVELVAPGFIDVTGAAIHPQWVALDLQSTTYDGADWEAKLATDLLGKGYRIVATIGRYQLMRRS